MVILLKTEYQGLGVLIIKSFCWHILFQIYLKLMIFYNSIKCNPLPGQGCVLALKRPRCTTKANVSLGTNARPMWRMVGGLTFKAPRVPSP